jgi:hypothetical protein
MPGRRTGRIGLAIATIAVALLASGCLPPAPPGGGGGTPSLKVTPSPARFPTTPPPYSPMPVVHVTITNNGTDTIGSIVVHPVGVYSVPSNNCSTLTPGRSCTADVQFCPSSPNRYVETLMVTGRDTKNAASIQAGTTLDGTAT